MQIHYKDAGGGRDKSAKKSTQNWTINNCVALYECVCASVCVCSHVKNIYICPSEGHDERGNLNLNC